jgi:hypothetical protein
LGTSRQQRQEITEEIKSLAQVKYGGGQQNTLGTDEKPKHRANDKMRSCSDRDEQIRQEIDMKAKFSDLTQSKGEEQLHT